MPEKQTDKLRPRSEARPSSLDTLSRLGDALRLTAFPRARAHRDWNWWRLMFA